MINIPKSVRNLLYFAAVAGVLYVYVSGYIDHSHQQAMVSEEVARVNSVDLEKVPIATWLWTPPWQFNDARKEELLAFAAQEHISSIYIYSGDGITKDLHDRQQVVASFIISAHARGIQVQALGGDPDWSLPDYRSTPLDFFDSVLDYNRTAPAQARFDGIQFDVEPYGQEDFNGRETKGLQQYLDMADAIVAKYNTTAGLAEQGFKLGFTATYWLDGENATSIVSWRDQSAKGAGLFLMDELNQIANGYVVLMDYRNFARGDDGSIAHAQGEIDYASQYAPRVKVIIGQETTDADPPKVTFLGMTKEAMKIEMKRIAAAFISKTAFGGFSIHNLESYMHLK